MENQVRLMVIGAHPDDCELAAGGTAALYRSAGNPVKFLYSTNGDAGHHEIGGPKLARIRAEEVRQSCMAAGIEYKILDIHDGMLEADLRTREKFIIAIREFNPDIIITHRTCDYHPDHRNTGLLVQDSSFLLGVPNICPFVPCMKKKPVILNSYDRSASVIPFRADVVIGIDEVIETKFRMVSAHKSQFLEWLPWLEGNMNEVPKDEKEKILWLRNRALRRNEKIACLYRDQLIKKYGKEKGNRIRYAEAFQVNEYGAPLSDALILA